MKMKNSPLDLGFGYPKYMTKYWENFTKTIKVKYSHFSDYNCAIPSKKIESLIKKLHKNQEHLVVGIGASQLVSAASYAVKKVYGLDTWVMKDLYWGRLKVLINFGNSNSKILTNSAKLNTLSNCVNFIVHPNNPDGCSADYFNNSDETSFTVIDACYSWPQYKNDITVPKADIIIYSLAKSLGLAGLRIGYAYCKDKKIANAMTEYVELSTGGYSTAAELIVEKIKQKDVINAISYGKKILNNRREKLKHIENTKKLPFTIENGDLDGMFIWCKHKTDLNGKESIEKQYNIISIEGSFFGATDQFFRLNLGCSDQDFEELLRRLNDIKANKD
jgi:histidinol-phosphate/aromatic aminotransferase/cobyric acid decarboxylase-like protein